MNDPLTSENDTHLDELFWRTLGQELATHPDLIEMAEEIAEQFRSSIYESDDLEDRSIELLANLGVDPNPLADEPEMGYSDRLDRATRLFASTLRGTLRPMIDRVFSEGDWKLP